MDHSIPDLDHGTTSIIHGTWSAPFHSLTGRHGTPSAAATVKRIRRHLHTVNPVEIA